MMNAGNRRRTDGDHEENGFRIAVMPDMKTLWHLVYKTVNTATAFTRTVHLYY